jgi:hypothetical protein
MVSLLAPDNRPEQVNPDYEWFFRNFPDKMVKEQINISPF